VLKQAQQIGMMSDYHSYLITSLDLHSVGLEEFKYGGTNITALRLVDPDDPELQKVVQNWVYAEVRYGRKLDLPPPRVSNLDHSIGLLSARSSCKHAAQCFFVIRLSVSG